MPSTNKNQDRGREERLIPQLTKPTVIPLGFVSSSLHPLESLCYVSQHASYLCCKYTPVANDADIIQGLAERFGFAARHLPSKPDHTGPHCDGVYRARAVQLFQGFVRQNHQGFSSLPYLIRQLALCNLKTTWLLRRWPLPSQHRFQHLPLHLLHLNRNMKPSQHRWPR